MIKKVLKMRISALVLGLSLSVSFPAMAASESEPLPMLLEKLKEEGATVLDRFPVGDHLNGYALLLRSSGKVEKMIVYATKDGQFTFNGHLVDAEARNVTKAHISKYLPANDYTAALENIANSHWITSHDDHGSKVAYVIHDPRCPFCKRAYSLIMQQQHRSGIEVRWLPVAALGAKSLDMAAALLQSAAPFKLQRDYNVGYFPSEQELRQSEKWKAAVIDNTHLMEQFGISGTPALILVDRNSNKVEQIINGYQPGPIQAVFGL